MFDPATLTALGSLGGLLGKGGGDVKVNQNTSVSSLSGVSLSISNILPGGTGGATISSTPQSANPVASTTPEPAYASSPAWGAFPDTANSTAILDTLPTNSAATSGILSNPLLLGGIALLGALAFMTMKRGKR